MKFEKSQINVPGETADVGSSVPKPDKNAYHEQVFQTFLAFGGDLTKTALALDLRTAEVERLAAAENWAAKVAQWNELREGRNSQIQINRAMNYVQAHRLRALLDKVLASLGEADAEALVARLTVPGNSGPEFRTRPLTDLVKAAESCHIMTARALGDTAAERPEDGNGKKGSNVALQVIAAMNSADQLGIDSMAIVREQIVEESGPKE